MESIMMLAIMVATVLWPAEAEADELVPVGLQKQLFVDDYVIDQTKNVTRELGKVTKHPSNPLVIADQPWEQKNRLGFYMNVLWDEEHSKFKMWYLAQHRGWKDLNGFMPKTNPVTGVGLSGVGYAESEDGVIWTKPAQDVFTYGDIVKGTPPNSGTWTNIVHQGMGFSCFIDPTVPWGHPEKYKAAFDSSFDAREDGEDICKTVLGYSSDGIHWNYYNDGNAVTGRAADTQNQILWDPIAERYLLICRWDIAGDVAEGECRGTRVMEHENNDLMNAPTAWNTLSKVGILREGIEIERERRQIHAMTVWPYEGVYFGFLCAMEGDLYAEYGDAQADLQTRHENNIVNFYIATSRDAVDWDLRWMYAEKPLIPRGPAGSWDKDGIHVPNLITKDDKHWLYYLGMSERFGMNDPSAPMGIGLATLRLDGFVCLEAKDEWGQVTTKPFKLEGDTLEVNIDASDGEFLLEVLDAKGKPIPGFTANDAEFYNDVDELRLKPQWEKNKDLSGLNGKVIRLKFYLHNAKLYAFQIQ